MLYRTIYADPPWPERGAGKIKRGADRHYPLMPVEEIIALADFVKARTAESAHLYLWVTNNYLPAGLRVMAAWGFRYVTTVTWLKYHMGLGQYFRGMTEHCLFGVPGKCEYRRLDSGKRAQGVTGFMAGTGRHSAKPEDMRQMIEAVSWPPRLELFARKRYPCWDAWGNEVED